MNRHAEYKSSCNHDQNASDALSIAHLRLLDCLQSDDPELRSGKQKARCGDRTDGPGPEGKSGVRVLHGPAQLLVVMPESEAQQPPQA